MRYRVTVFDPAVAPRTAAGFLTWTRVPTWTEHNASDPGATMLELLAYLREAQRQFPMDEGVRPALRSGQHVLVEHQVARDQIQLVFETDDVRALSAQLQGLATQHHVGFYEISVGDAAPVLDPPKAMLPARKPWWKRW
ncbi:hypothetical protein SAMN05428989_0368 [Pseudoxanthomonas sp. GM95]|uniref:hypothetical protein n=1 Tax=Pseudoxanthomonas sp. GM95 TaxID=1881043 RepID=UPI0008B065CF|nr:hypothetical protein [Pseudoxanthomonas sp. GM95]SEK56935.1 hypothetical protein SAMN05428989_0368 [Pseudoxanthomonas sp. GM95]